MMLTSKKYPPYVPTTKIRHLRIANSSRMPMVSLSPGRPAPYCGSLEKLTHLCPELFGEVIEGDFVGVDEWSGLVPSIGDKYSTQPADTCRHTAMVLKGCFSKSHCHCLFDGQVKSFHRSDNMSQGVTSLSECSMVVFFKRM